MSVQAAPIVLDFEDGIDRKTLRRLRDRFLLVNQQRWERAASALTWRQQVVLEVLPLVFHLNHPSLPGYVDGNCPVGVSGYTPSASTLNAARRLARSFNYRDKGVRNPDLDALFLMGSPGTLGHSVASDLDVWLCHRADLPEQGVLSLERKAGRLAGWAATLGVELHVFVFSAADWRAGRQKAEVTGENCGSAQHYLLLDEFYRTGIHLAGQYPLWWLIPVDQDRAYEDCRRRLVECRFIKPREYIDFGPVPAIPPEEFPGAGIWQLYKGIDAPWKAILKLLLIECYATDADGRLLSADFKQAVYEGRLDADRLDPYVMLYRRLERWLLAQDASDRLDLVRRSLYLKSGLPLSRAGLVGDQWRTDLLRHLVADWHWSPEQLQRLDDRQRWQAEEVIGLRRSVVTELTHSYRLLSRMAREQGTQAAISDNDIHLLGRKLYAAFQRKAGKVELINPDLVASLTEENLSFHHQSEQGRGGEGWLLYRDLEDPSDAFWKPVIRRSGNLAELLVWCYCNGLLDRTTRLNVRAGTSVATVTEVREVLETLSTFLPMPIKPASRQALSKAVRPLQNLLLVNIAVDPLPHLSERGLHKLSSRNDSLGFSGGRDNLVASVDQVTLNSWHEVSLQHYAAGDTLVQCLKNILAQIALNPGALPDIRVFASGRGHGNAIARRVQELFGDVLRQFFAGGQGPHALRYILEMDRRYFLMQFNGREPGFVALEDREALFEALNQPKAYYLPVVADRYALRDDPTLRAVCEASEPGNIQLFWRLAGDTGTLWVVDECGSVWTRTQQVGRRRHLLSPLLRFLDNLVERRLLRHLDTAGPATDIRCYELVRQDGQWRAQPRPEQERGFPLPGLELQAVGFYRDEALAFDIYCHDREFTVDEYGDQLIPAVAHYIRSLRRTNEPYPIYLSDLHLPQEQESQPLWQEVRTCQYLYHRSRLEDALNRHLR
ncbi:class I adenylate cyclase [Marinobacter oulmenensis]|uniref:Adenylate cyclase class 1 n=1 Tax=Marinobacter oulmenensis TaxID=643747 RepID=A0A840U9J6_9GAMM|nr:class I adenylate cyclase [Marinobacter oulmenensis]MBB5320873.1 adenylate cyclase class 1 [Marinobacter oulmenensis]